MNRDAMLQALTAGSEPWDIFVIGGGATGLGIAVDAAARGYRTVLVEQSDFAKGTSSRSTKLIHGGVRAVGHFRHWRRRHRAGHCGGRGRAGLSHGAGGAE